MYFKGRRLIAPSNIDSLYHDCVFIQTLCYVTSCAYVMPTLQVRSLEFSRQETIAVWLSNDKRKNTLLVHIPKEYDLVS